jgi:hypothetical protein
VAVLPDPAASQAVLVGVAKYAALEQLPSVANNLAGLKAALTDPDIWGLPARNCSVQSQPRTADAVLDTLQRVAASATDTLVVYFAGHGLVDPWNDEELYLALPGSDRDRAYRTALPYSWVRRELQSSPVRRKVVILDCCYSGRALGKWMGESDTDLADRLGIEGTCVLTATARTRRALALPDERFTAFTGELISLLTDGIPDGPDLLDMDTIYRHLSMRLRSRSLPLPQRGQLDNGGNIAIGRNQAPDDRRVASAQPELINNTDLIHRPRRRHSPKRATTLSKRASQTPIATSTDIRIPPQELREPLAGPISPSSPVTDASPESQSSVPPRSSTRTSAQTESLPDLDSGQTASSIAGSRTPPELIRETEKARTRPRFHLLALGAAVILVAIGLSITALVAFSPQAPRLPTAANMRFSAQRYSDGLIIGRHWELTRPGGVMLTESLSASSATGKALIVTYSEPVPPQIAANLQDLKFTPAPARTVPADRMVEWVLHVPAHGTTVVGYQATVGADGISKSRLTRWAADLDKLAPPHSQALAPVTIKKLIIKPRTIRVEVGQHLQLELHGFLSSGKKASRLDLARVQWDTRNTAIAVITQSGRLTAKSPGRTIVTARIGAANKSVPVVVVANPTSPIPGAGSTTPPTGSSGPPPGPSPTQSPAPTPTPTPTLTPSPL